MYCFSENKLNQKLIKEIRKILNIDISDKDMYILDILKTMIIEKDELINQINLLKESIKCLKKEKDNIQYNLDIAILQNKDITQELDDTINYVVNKIRDMNSLIKSNLKNNDNKNEITENNLTE